MKHLKFLFVFFGRSARSSLIQDNLAGVRILASRFRLPQLELGTKQVFGCPPHSRLVHRVTPLGRMFQKAENFLTVSLSMAHQHFAPWPFMSEGS